MESLGFVNLKTPEPLKWFESMKLLVVLGSVSNGDNNQSRIIGANQVCLSDPSLKRTSSKSGHGSYQNITNLIIVLVVLSLATKSPWKSLMENSALRSRKKGVGHSTACGKDVKVDSNHSFCWWFTIYLFELFPKYATDYNRYLKDSVYDGNWTGVKNLIYSRYINYKSYIQDIINSFKIMTLHTRLVDLQ